MKPSRGFLLAVATLGLGLVLWDTHQVVVDDQAHYITSGINLVGGHGFTNPDGEPETWFPPLYPLLIGLVTVATGDGLVAAKLLSLVFSAVWVVAVYRAGRSIAGDAAGLAGAVILIALPVRALFSVLSMSQALFSALLWSAAALHVADLEDRRPTTAPLVALLLGLASLTRPEGLLPAALFIADRAARTWAASPGRALRHAGLMAAVMAVVLLPYSVFLYRATGTLAVTGKSSINLAVGRAHAAGEPLYRIDPGTLDVVMNTLPGGFSEITRYARNLREEVRIVAGHLDYLWLCWAGLGAWLLLERRRGGAVALIWAGAPLAVMPAYVMASPFVVPYLPVFTVAAGAGIVHVSRAALGVLPYPTSRMAAGLVVVVTLLWTAAGMGQDLRSYHDPGREAVAERQAGEWLRQSAAPGEAVAAVGGTVAYHSKLLSRRLTGDDLTLVTAYMRAQDIRYLAVSGRDAGALHASVRALLDEPSATGLSLLHTSTDPSGWVCRILALDPAGR